MLWKFQNFSTKMNKIHLYFNFYFRLCYTILKTQDFSYKENKGIHKHIKMEIISILTGRREEEIKNERDA